MLMADDIFEFPEITDEVQIKHGGEQGAAVGKKFIAFGKDSIEVVKKAKKLGYAQGEVLLMDIPRFGVLYA